MNIQKRIKEIVTEDGTSYIFGSLNFVNVILDKLHRQKNFPCCVSLQSIDGTFNVTDGVYNPSVRETMRCVVGFADSVRFDVDAELAEDKCYALKQRCIDLLVKLNNCGDFLPITDVTYNVMYDAMDANLIIVLANFELTEAVGNCQE